MGYRPEDFPISPMLFYYEVTLACDLVCKHCRASAQAEAHPEELSPELARALIDQVAQFPRPPMLVLTGGDPLKRGDLFSLIEHATARGLHVALTPSATPLATREAFRRAQEAGIRALGISLDAADRAVHDSFRGWEGSFDRTLQMIHDGQSLGLPIQVNTTITRRNLDQVDLLAELLAGFRIAMWSVFFLVPVGRGATEERISPGEYERVFARLWFHAQRQPYALKTTEAPHYRRYVLQHGGDPLRPTGSSRAEGGPPLHRAPLGVTDGKGVMFVSHKGEIFPAGFLPLSCGRFPEQSVVETYQRHPLFVALRDPDRFKGKCGICEYRYVCGGSRARAFAVTGDPLESEPDCIYEPRPDIAPLRP